MKMFNVGDRVFTFIHGGTTFTILPKNGHFVKERAYYDVETVSGKGTVHKLKRFNEVWVKKSDEGINSNYVELPSTEYVSACMKRAEAEGFTEFLKKEEDMRKAEQERIAELERINRARESELRQKDQELQLKLAMLKKVEEEAISAAAKRKV